jgi:hypothetical protein
VVAELSPVVSDHNAAALRAEAWASWREDAACRGLGVMFDSPSKRMQRSAADLCTVCPVLAACRSWVLGLAEREDPDGICGGWTFEQRRRFRTAIQRAQKRSVVALDDPEDGPLGEMSADQPGYLGGPDSLGRRPAYGAAELGAGALCGPLGPPEGPAIGDQIVSHIAHAVMMPRPDG